MTFEELKAKADKLKTKRDQALGVMKSIEDGWEKKYGTRDVSKVCEKLQSMESELSDLDKEFNDKLSQAESMMAVAG